jgi:hypothetical protein
MGGINYSGMTNREILLVIADKVDDLDDAVNGAGRPGLVERVTTLEASKPSRKERWGVIGAVVAGVVAGAARVFGVELTL